MSVCLSACPSVRLLVCLSVRPPACLPVRPSACLSACSSVRLHGRLSHFLQIVYVTIDWTYPRPLAGDCYGTANVAPRLERTLLFVHLPPTRPERPGVASQLFYWYICLQLFCWCICLLLAPRDPVKCGRVRMCVTDARGRCLILFKSHIRTLLLTTVSTVEEGGAEPRCKMQASPAARCRRPRC